MNLISGKMKKKNCYRPTEKGSKRILMQKVLAQGNFNAHFDIKNA
jgi:hypothetical protein